MFSKILKQAKVDRLEVNRKFNECIVKIGYLDFVFFPSVSSI